LQTPAADTKIEFICDEAEIDEQWSFVEKKSNQRWIWYAIYHSTNTILAYVFGKRKDIVDISTAYVLPSFMLLCFYAFMLLCFYAFMLLCFYAFMLLKLLSIWRRY